MTHLTPSHCSLLMCRGVSASEASDDRYERELEKWLHWDTGCFHS